MNTRPQKHIDLSPNEEKVRERGLVIAFAEMSDEQKTMRVLELDRQVRILEKTIEQKRKDHQREMLLQSSGRTVDAMTVITMERLRRDHDRIEGRATALAQALRDAAEFVGASDNATRWRELADRQPPAPTPTPGKYLLAFRPKPAVVTAHDVALAVEEALGAPCPELLRILIDRAVPALQIVPSPEKPTQEVTP